MGNVAREYADLPSGKPHISFSEVRDWRECSFRHRLKHINKVVIDRPSPQLAFGTAVHLACEHYLKTRTMQGSIAEEALRSVWATEAGASFGPELLEQYIKEADAVLAEVPGWFEATFPEWELVDAEHALYEPIKGHPHAFKGFIDAIIACRGARGKQVIWLLDWKTTSWGWSTDKKTDDLVRSQLVLYKNYWSTKAGVDPRSVRCGFILLKRTAKPGDRCELVVTSVGDVTTGRSLRVVNDMLSSMKRGIAVKNRTACDYCDYRGTEHCP